MNDILTAAEEQKKIDERAPTRHVQQRGTSGITITCLSPRHVYPFFLLSPSRWAV